MSGRGRPRSSSLRDLGNAAFKAKKWQEAIDYYSQAIEIEFDREAEHVGALFCNRAAAYLNLCEYDLGEPNISSLLDTCLPNLMTLLQLSSMSMSPKGYDLDGTDLWNDKPRLKKRGR